MGIFEKFKSKKNNIDNVSQKIQDTKKEIIISKYNKGLEKSKESFIRKIKVLSNKYRKIDENYFKELEEIFIYADLGVFYTQEIIKKLKEEVKINKAVDHEKINKIIIEYLYNRYVGKDKKNENIDLNIKENKLNIILVIGVNGVGKTTSIGKLAKRLQSEGKKVELAAADTFRAGAVKQLEEWANKINIIITKPEKEFQDPASVVFKGIQNAKNNNSDVLIVDTAGRLHNKENLMKELNKINKIIERENNSKPEEILLVLDATTGQNGVLQASAFNDVVKLTGIILTKMDSSSKGGIILSIKDSFNIPVKFIGLGEGLDDFQKFNIEDYLYALTNILIEDEQNN